MESTLSTPRTTGTSLRRNRLGTIAIVFFVVAAAAPLVGMTGAVPIAIVLGTGPAAPGAYLVVGLALLLFSVGYGAMSHRVTNTGAFFAYVGRGLGIGPGVGSAFVSMLAYISIQLAIFGFFGALMGAQMKSRAGIDAPWWLWALLAWAAVLVLSLLSVDVGAKVLGVLMVLEVASLAVLAVVVLADGGPEGIDVAASFSPTEVFGGGFAGSAGIALAFAFASYIGFEATAIYGEETRDPKRSVPRATYGAIGVIAALFAVASFAVVTALGSSAVVDRAAELSTVDGVPLTDPAAVLFGIADEYVGGWLATVMSWLVLSSLFAGLLAFQSSAARYFYSMGRARVLPVALDRTNGRGAPHVASLVTSMITLLVVVFFAVRDLDPVLNLFYWFSGLAVVAILLVEVLVCVAVVVYFRRTREDTRVWHTVVAPTLSAVALAIGVYLIISRFGLLAGTVVEGHDPTEPFGLNVTGWVLVALPFVAVVVGWVVGFARRRNESQDAVSDIVT